MRLLLTGKSRSLWAMVLLLILGGCVHPKVTYVSTPKVDYEGKIKFRLGATRVVLGESKDDPNDLKKSYIDISKDTKLSADKVSALTVPREDSTELYAIIPQSQWLWMVETKLSVNYFDNTRLVQKIGIEVEDSRIKVVQAVAGIIGALIKFDLPARPPDMQNIQVPVAIDVEPDQNNKWEELPRNPGWYYQVDTGSHEADAVERSLYFEAYKDRFFSLFYSTRTVPISSCRQSFLKIAFRSLDNTYAEKVKLPIQVADYKYIRTYEMPDKGAISAHTLCGADIVTEKSEIASGYEVLSEMVKQAKAIKEAQKK